MTGEERSWISFRKENITSGSFKHHRKTPEQENFDTPSCVVLPESANDISAAVKILMYDECQFSVKGGGHTAFAGAASITYGIQIDMTSMKTVTANKDRTVTSISAGAR